MGFFSAGGGWTGTTKKNFREYKGEIFKGRDSINNLLQDSLSSQLGLINSTGSNISSQAQMMAARGSQGAVPGAINSAQQQSLLAALPYLLQAQAGAQQGYAGGMMNNNQNFLTQLGNFNQMSAKKKAPGLGVRLAKAAVGGIAGALTGGGLGGALANLFGGGVPTPTGTPSFGGPMIA